MTTPNPRPSFPTEEKHFHPFAALRFLRETLAVYLIPLVNVLFERNWPAFWTALPTRCWPLFTTASTPVSASCAFC